MNIKYQLYVPEHHLSVLVRPSFLPDFANRMWAIAYFFCFLMQILRQIWPFFNRFWPKKPKFSRNNQTVFSFFKGLKNGQICL